MSVFDGIDLRGLLVRAVKAVERVAEALEVANRDRALYWTRNDLTVSDPPVFEALRPGMEGDEE